MPNPRTKNVFERQVQAAKSLALNARSFRQKHGNCIAVFDNRAAALLGLDIAVREMAARTERDRNLVGVVAPRDAFWQAVATLADDSEDAHTDATLQTMLRHLRRAHAVAGSSLVDGVLAELGVQTPTIDAHTDALRLPLLLRGDPPDGGPWRFDPGILDEAYGCPDLDRRESHRISIESGSFNFGICRGCPMLWNDSCSYVKGTLRAGGIIMAHLAGLERAVTVLLGSPPTPDHVAGRSLSKGYLRAAKKSLGRDGTDALKSILRGGIVARHALDRLCKETAELRRRAAVAERYARDEAEAINRGAPSIGTAGEAWQRAVNALNRRRVYCQLLTIYAAARWYEWQGKPLPPTELIKRPLVMPPAHGAFVAFPDNIDEWRAELEPLGVRKVGWRQIEKWERDAERKAAPKPKRDRMHEVIEAAIDVARARLEVSQKNVAERLNISIETLKSRLRAKKGGEWRWAWVKEWAETIAKQKV